MAKKKVATHGNQTKKHEQDVEIATHGNQTKKQEQEVEIGMAMDDASMEKLQSLKDLNDILVKQTIELRQQVSSLKQSNGSLEAEVVRSKSEMDMLRAELTQLDERTVELELERTVVVVFAGQIGEVIESERNGFKKEKFEIEGKLEGLERKLVEVVGEKDENERMAKAEIEARILELNAMKERLTEAEKREKLVSGDLEKLKSEYGSAMEEKEQMGRKIDEILRDKSLLEKSLVEYNTEINEIKSEIERIRIEKDEIKQEKDVEYLKRNELENAVTGLNVKVSSLQAEEEKLRRVYVAELEYKCSEGVEKGIEMQRHLDELVKVKNEMEVRIQSLIDEKGLVDKDLNEALGKIDEYKLRMKEMADENDKIGVDNVEKENEIKELEKQVVGLRNVVSGFEKSCSDQQEKIKNLVSELDYYKDGFERVTMEKNEARKALDEEKQNALSLQQRIVDMEKNIEINLEMIKKIKAENSEISIEKEELDRHFSELKKDIATRNKEITDARGELSAMRGKSELADSKSQMVLNALKSTAVFVQSKDENDVSNGSYLLDEQMKGEIELYVVEMEAIKNAFKTKKNEANDMRKQLAKLENSMAEAHRNKNLLTMVSSVTSLFAAIAFAYLARGR